MIHAFLSQYFSWTWTHAIGDPWGPVGGRWLMVAKIFAMTAPLALLAIPRIKSVPWSWRLVITGTYAQIILCPEHKFVLQMLPFLCIMAVSTLQKAKLLPWFVLLGVIAAPRLYHQLFVRPYGLADIYAYANILRAHKVQEPAWTNCDPIYVAMNWKLQQSYLDQIEGHIPLGMNTIAWFDIHDKLSNEIWGKDWIEFDIPLQRGWYKWLRLLKHP